MSTNKNISGDWYITLDGGVGTIYIDGNLDVAGNITYVSELAVDDAFIQVAAKNDGSVKEMGMVAVINTNLNRYAGIQYNADVGAWQISSGVYANGAPNTVAYSNIATSTTAQSAAGNVTEVQYNYGNIFSASPNFKFDPTSNTLSVLTGSQVLGNIGTAPTATANAVTLYNLAPGVGASGVYARTSTTQDELISLTKARLFAIIF